MTDVRLQNIHRSLNNAEKRVLISLEKLKGQGTPAQIIRESMPPATAKVLEVLEEQLRPLLNSYDIEASESEMNSLLERMLAVKKGDIQGAEILEILMVYLSARIFTLEVPMQREIVAKALGEILPAIRSRMEEGASEMDVIPLASVETMNSASWLQSKGLVEMSEVLETYYSLSKMKYGKRDLPERKALKLIDKNNGRMTMEELKGSPRLDQQEISIAVGWLKRKGWVNIVKGADSTLLEMTDVGKDHIKKKGNDELLVESLRGGEMKQDECDEMALSALLKRRNFLKKREVVTRTISLTDDGRKVLKMGLSVKAEVSQLESQHFKGDAWKNVEIRPYDIHSFAPEAPSGKSHPIQILREKIRRIFLEMGFTEMDYDFVQSSFWNMDVLFTPQDHPARDMQDTLYLKEPASIMLDDSELVSKVKKMHEEGDGTSKGWGYKWDDKIAQKALLRTHTTVNTIRYLSENPQPPRRVFSIGRVFRNEAIDSTHLPEFMQIEGIIMEEESNLQMLFGILTEFYKRLGFEKIRIRPGYFPYTEPSLEVDIFFNGEWMELGGAGIFRPEVVSPLGVDHPVLAWGIGLERLAMVLFDVKDMRSLYISDIDWVKSSGIPL